MMPNSDTVTSTHTSELKILSLPKAVSQAHIFPQFPADTLLSIDLLCNAGCTAEFDSTTLHIQHNRKKSSPALTPQSLSSSTLMHPQHCYQHYLPHHLQQPAMSTLHIRLRTANLPSAPPRRQSLLTALPSFTTHSPT